MSNLNPSTIDNVSILEVKELDEFFKEYNKYRNLSADEQKKTVLQENFGKFTNESYDRLLNVSKSYTKNGKIPTELEWEQIRVLYREIGNQKISESKEQIEKLSKQYSGVSSIQDYLLGMITPKQVVDNLETAEKRVDLIKTLRVAISVLLGIAGFTILTLFSKLIIDKLLGSAEIFVVQILAGVIALAGIVLGAWAGKVLMGMVLNKAKRSRDNAEKTEAIHHEKITILQTSIKTAEERIKRIESQYGVEIIAKTDYSALAKEEQRLARQASVAEAKKVENSNEKPMSDENESQEDSAETLVDASGVETTEDGAVNEDEVEKQVNTEDKKVAQKKQTKTKTSLGKVTNPQGRATNKPQKESAKKSKEETNKKPEDARTIKK